MGILSLIIALALVSLSVAKKCMNATIPVTISSRQGVFSTLRVPHTQEEVTAIAQAAAIQGVNATAQALTGYHTVSGIYNISTQFCAPDNLVSANPTVQVLTHGIGFDKTYWDLSYKNFKYSYVDVATDKYGYCTLSYDRLGIGDSSHGEPRDEIQANLEIAATYEITMMLRNGRFPGVNKNFKTVVHVGHSFGSTQTYTLADMYPSATDGIVLTGFSFDSSYVGNFALGANFVQANTNQPLRFGNVTASQVETMLADAPLSNYLGGLQIASMAPSQNLPDGYLIASNAGAIQSVLLYPNYFDPDLLPLLEETKQPVTVGELLTLFSTPTVNAFKGPVMVIVGNQDLPFCGGNCFNAGSSLPSIPADVQKHFPNVPTKDFVTYIQPNAGHGLNLHYNASGLYDVINSFLNSKGLASK